MGGSDAKSRSGRQPCCAGTWNHSLDRLLRAGAPTTATGGRHHAAIRRATSGRRNTAIRIDGNGSRSSEQCRNDDRDHCADRATATARRNTAPEANADRGVGSRPLGLEWNTICLVPWYVRRASARPRLDTGPLGEGPDRLDLDGGALGLTGLLACFRRILTPARSMAAMRGRSTNCPRQYRRG